MTPSEILKTYWGHHSFRGSQEEVIETVLDRRDVLALMPTGGGKSVCYQVPALCREGLCIVISPLIALIQDQVAGLKSKGIKALSLTGGLSTEEVINRLDNCEFGNYKFLYLSPERLQQPMVRERLAKFDVNLIAIDEAHCISQWGHDFRPAYLECALLRELQPHAPIIALTATATREVASEIIENLGLRSCVTFRDSFLRDNIVYRVVQAEDKEYRIKQLCRKGSMSGIVYVRTRRLAETLSAKLRTQGSSAISFHGGLKRDEKAKRLNGWMGGKTQWMVATNAFGMGVDKPDVRMVIHYQVPDCIENYFQEAGRAGRDGKEAEALLLVAPADEIQLRKQFLGALPDVAFLKMLYRTLNNYFQIPYGTGEGSTHNFHFNTFCETYKLNALLAYNGLLALDQYSVIALTQLFRQKTQVRFLASRAGLWEYLETHQRLSAGVQVLLRTYGGIFDYDTKINTTLVAKKWGATEAEVDRLLERLHKDEIIDYQPVRGDLQLSFLVPREDDRTINRFATQLMAYQHVKVRQLEQMLAYVKNRHSCRARQLLEYFGEQLSEDCGKCDVCRDRNQSFPKDPEPLLEEVARVLGEGPHTSKQLIRRLGYEEKLVLKALQLLLEARTIKVNEKNEYKLV